ncbi:hypothetical protein HS7_17740 [Sulfolobales archaeon HS-7]|nr:hypothetical protein HS7_17740 [Sulfolobales archaeon HS-7]
MGSFKSVFGPVITNNAGVFCLSNSKEEIDSCYQLAKRLYNGFEIQIVDISDPLERFDVIQFDPDIPFYTFRYAVIIRAE